MACECGAGAAAADGCSAGQLTGADAGTTGSACSACTTRHPMRSASWAWPAVPGSLGAEHPVPRLTRLRLQRGACQATQLGPAMSSRASAALRQPPDWPPLTWTPACQVHAWAGHACRQPGRLAARTLPTAAALYGGRLQRLETCSRGCAALATPTHDTAGWGDMHTRSLVPAQCPLVCGLARGLQPGTSVRARVCAEAPISAEVGSTTQLAGQQGWPGQQGGLHRGPPPPRPPSGAPPPGIAQHARCRPPPAVPRQRLLCPTPGCAACA